MNNQQEPMMFICKHCIKSFLCLDDTLFIEHQDRCKPTSTAPIAELKTNHQTKEPLTKEMMDEACKQVEYYAKEPKDRMPILWQSAFGAAFVHSEANINPTYQQWCVDIADQAVLAAEQLIAAESLETKK